MSESRNPSVDIVMCAFENERTIERAIKSLLIQDYRYWKLIVVVSRSNDQTLNLVKSFNDERITVIDKEIKQSWTASSLEGLSLSTAKYFMWLDADDFISQNWLKEIVAELETKCIQSGCYGLTCLSNDGGYSQLVNPSNNRVFGFLEWENRFFRVVAALLLPDSFGLVNVLYAVWNREFLLSTINWKADEMDDEYDIDFILQALTNKPIGYISSVVLTRENNGHKSDKSRIMAENNVQKFKFSEIIWQSMLSYPKYRRLKIWLCKQDSVIKLLGISMIGIRTVLASASPILIRLQNLFLH